MMNVAYFIAKENLAFVKHPALIKLLQCCGVKMGTNLFSDHTCANMIGHIASRMK